MTGQGWDEDQSGVEATRKLVEEASKWNETLVVLNRKVLFNAGLLIGIFYLVYALSLARLLVSGGNIHLLNLLVVIGLSPFAIYDFFLLRGGYRNYAKNVARRDVWRDRFEILRKKEEELSRLLSDAAEAD